MPNKNYVAGRRKEYKIRTTLLDSGYDIAQRTAGSHSPIDVFAISKKLNKIALIQAKPLSFPKIKEEKILKEYEWLNNKFDVVFKFIK